MVGFNQHIKVLHLEPTTVCNAKCPQCSRENKDLYKHDINKSELTISKCNELFSPAFIKQLDKMFMCGVFGDPASTNDALDIYRYFKTHNPDITLGLNTNGSIRNPHWWRDLASIFSNPTDYVVFSIDGLEDTNHIYRRGVHWDKVIQNASTFIDAGGSAHWDMLIFKHNEHQIHQAEEMARELGFKYFRTKVSKRFNIIQVDGLDAPNTHVLPNIHNATEIKCHALEDNSIYVSANGRFLPCCWLGVHAFDNDQHMETLLNSPNWNALSNSWKSSPHNVCSRTCGVNEIQKTSFESQWNKEIQLG
jgi:hypothetical protein